MASNESVTWRDLYPFQSHYRAVGSVRQHYVDEGQGAPLLLVHGNPTWSFYWRELIKSFRGDFRAVAPDHIGCGLSDKPAKYAYTLSQHIENLVGLIEHLDLNDITLLVHDWGGAIGLGAAIRLPRRFARFVLFNTGAFPPPFIPLRIRACRIPLFGKIAIQGFNAFAGAAIRMATEKPERMTPAVRAGLLAPYDSWSNRVATYRFVQDIPASPRHPTWHVLENIEKNLPTLADRPVQFIWGMKDWCFKPLCLDRLLRSFPRADVLRVADAGHYVVEDAVEKIIPTLTTFFNEHPIAASVS